MPTPHSFVPTVQFRFRIVDLTTNEVFHTSNLKVASEFAKDLNFKVLDLESGLTFQPPTL